MSGCYKGREFLRIAGPEVERNLASPKGISRSTAWGIRNTGKEVASFKGVKSLFQLSKKSAELVGDGGHAGDAWVAPFLLDVVEVK